MTASPSYLLKVTLKKTPRLIWRRFIVPSGIRLDRLHGVLQTVIGWSEPRPHVFFHGKQGFHPTGAVPEGGLPEKKYTLSNLIVRSGGKLKYIHDPAEEKWIHEVVVESVRFADLAWPYPICCTEGVRACPPSGVGGVDGFAHLLKVIDGQVDDGSLLEQFADFQPDHFDLSGVNRTFGVTGPCDIIRHSFQMPKPKKSAHSTKGDPFYRLGLKLKMTASSGIE